MRKAHTTALAAAVAIALGGAATAQQPGQQRSGQEQTHSFQSSEHGRQADQEMQRLDRNRDSRIDQSEAQSDPQLIAAWADIDLSRDGSVDATEYYLYAAQRRIAELERAGGASARQQAEQQQVAEQLRQAADQLSSAAAQLRRAAAEQQRMAAQQQRSAFEQQQREQEARQSDAFEQRGRQGQQEQQRSALEQQGEQQEQQEQQRSAQEQQGDQQEQQRSAFEQQQQRAARPSFEDVDRDSDGSVSRTELALLEDADFESLDTNQDGSISRSEYEESTQ